MDTQTRHERAALVKDLAVQIHDSRAKCPPLAAMWSAVLAGIATNQMGAIAMSATEPAASSNLIGGQEQLLPSLWVHAPEWLGLDPESSQEMLLPDVSNADWKAKPDETGYVSLWAITNMLNSYAETGEVRWAPLKKNNTPWDTLCENNGIAWAAWHPNPLQNWGQPGVEKVAIVTFKEGREPGLSKYDIAKEFSKQATCNVHIISPEQIPERRRQEELSKALVIYGHPR